LITHSKIASIILAAGKGTRIGAPDKQKVCLPVTGTPAITRSLRTYDSFGISPHVLVVGHGAEQVMDLVSNKFENIYFAYQTEQKGTGHATKKGVKLLRDFNYYGDIFVVAGDKIIQPEILQKLISTFYEQKLDLAFLVSECESSSELGRVILSDDGKPVAIVESIDIARYTLLGQLWDETKKGPLNSVDAERMIRRLIKSEKKIQTAMEPIWSIIKSGEDLRHNHIAEITNGRYPFLKFHEGVEISMERLQKCNLANLSIYLFSAPALYDALNELSSNNAQKEEYLTDIVAVLSAKGTYKLGAVPLDDPHQVMAFNNQKELREINAYLRTKRHLVGAGIPSSEFHEPSKWLHILESNEMLSWFDRLYNGNRSISIEKLNRLKRLVKYYIKQYGDEEVTIARAPGRVNLMGRHIDHQGGDCNMIAIDREVFVVAGLRHDKMVHLSNLDGLRYPKIIFNAAQEIENQQNLSRSEVRKKDNDWSQYFKAALQRFQYHSKNKSLDGMNIAVSSDIPIAAGLGSSSALIVAIIEAMTGLYRLNFDDSKFIDICSEAEQYTGTTGGQANHAAMKICKAGQVAQTGFYPFEIKNMVPFPDDHLIVICDSHVTAQKSVESVSVINQKVSCFQLGYLFFKKKFPEILPDLSNLSNILNQTLKIKLADFYHFMKDIPEKVTRQEIEKLLPEYDLTSIFSTHNSYSGNYPVREVLMYGLAECDRSIRFSELLKNEKITDVGNLMNVSHNGDRVVKYDDNWNRKSYKEDISDSYLNNLNLSAAKNLKCASLYLQSGRYHCSIPEIDLIVDLAKSVNGVKGAQLSGAGLGGCAMVLVEESSVQELIRGLTDNYYAFSDLEPAIAVCTPVAGSGIFRS